MKQIIGRLKNFKEKVQNFREIKKQIKYVDVLDDEIQNAEKHLEHLSDKQSCLDAISHHLNHQEWEGEKFQ